MAPGDAPVGIVRWLRKLPCKLVLATIVLSLAVREWYPFSHFPMYSRFGPQTWYVFVTDETNRVIPTETYFGVSAMPLRRMFEARALRLRAAGAPAHDAAARAAVAVLSFLRAEARPRQEGLARPRQLRLWRTLSRIDRGGIGRRQQMLGELESP